MSITEKDTLKQNLPFIQAFIEGKKVQYRHEDDESWQEMSTDEFRFFCHLDYEFRIKPESQEFWFARIKNGAVWHRFNRNPEPSEAWDEVIHVRTVTE